MNEEIVSFSGFDEPLENWSKLPNSFIAALPLVTSLAELKVILYILRHTWGYKEYDQGKHITTDEFANGRKRKDGTRIDTGIGMSEPSIRSGINTAMLHGFICVDVDNHDLARVEKSYRLNITTNPGERSLPPEGKEFTSGGKEVYERSEIDTLDKKPNTETLSRKREKKAKADTIPALQMNAMKDALVAAFGWDAKQMTQPEWGIIQKSAKILCIAEFDTERVASFHAWCKAKFTTFTPITMTTHLSEYRAARLESPSTQPRSWADIPELRGITEIIT